jgi:two-component system alkaline phosphatase synthesis response regulator PhoP
MPKVLVVDDDLDILNLLKSVLEAYRFVVETATNGQEAIERTRAAGLDGIFMDLRMPVLDGFEALAILRREFPDLTVIILTASKTRDIVQQAQERGASACILKPFDPEEIRGVLRAAFGWRGEGFRDGSTETKDPRGG